MKRLAILLTLFSLILAGPASAAPATQPSELEKQTALLAEKVSALEARVKMLEQQLRDVRSGNRLQERAAPSPAPAPGPAPTPAPSAPELHRVPPLPYAPEVPVQPSPPAPGQQRWQQREINGLRFYVVPLR